MEILLIYLLKSGALLCLFYVTLHFLLKKETIFTFNRYFLLAGLLASMILPLITFTRTITFNLNPRELSNDPMTLGNGIGATTNLWPLFLLTIYILGVLLFSLRLTKEFHQLKLIIKKGKLQHQAGFTHVHSNKKITPFSFLSYIVYNPEIHTARELDAILEHEKIHSRQKHTLDILLMELCLIIQWFNPAAWLYRKSLKENLEFLADTSIKESSFDKKEYQYILLKQAIGPQQLSIVNPFFNSLIKKRIVMINQHPSNKLRALKSLFILPLLALFLLSFNVKTKYVIKNESIGQTTEETIELIIDKTTTDDELLKIKNDLKKDNIDFSYTTVRNNDGEISSLSIHVAGGGNGGNFNSNYNSQSDNETISPTYIIIDTEKNNISIGNAKNHVLHSNDHANVWVQKSNGDEEQKEIIIKNINGKKLITINGEEVTEKQLEELDIDTDENSFILIDTDDEKNSNKNIVIQKVSPGAKKHVIIKSDSDEDHDIKIIEKSSNGFFFLDADSEEEPLLIIDGKKSTMKAVKKLDPKDIKSINVLKGSAALKKYGKDATHGVVEITIN